jgi:hypothetical protein
MGHVKIVFEVVPIKSATPLAFNLHQPPFSPFVSFHISFNFFDVIEKSISKTYILPYAYIHTILESK